MANICVKGCFNFGGKFEFGSYLSYYNCNKTYGSNIELTLYRYYLSTRLLCKSFKKIGLVCNNYRDAIVVIYLISQYGIEKEASFFEQNHNLHQEKRLVYFVLCTAFFAVHTFPVCNVHVNIPTYVLTCRKERPTLYTATVQWGSKSLIIMYYAKHTYKIRASGSFHN